MAGGSITRITGGTFSTELEGGMEIHTDKFDIIAGKKNTIAGKNGTVKDKPQKPKTDDKHIIRGWWSSDKEGKKNIKEALIGDIVYFHIETKNIPDRGAVFMSLYDDDVKRAKEEKDTNKGSDRIILNKKKEDFVEVKANKIVRAIDLKNFSPWVEQEEDKTIELFFVCSYKGENVELPVSFGDYLKVKGIPKIIFVNGHWNKIANKIGMSPGSGGRPYWIFFTGKIDAYIASSRSYFNIKDSKEIFIDGSSLWGGSEDGQERKDRGYKYAKKHFDEIEKGLGGQQVFLISHSEGGACAAGVAKYLTEKGISVGESIMLSADEGDEFSVEGNYPAYQLVAGYLTNDVFTKRKIFNIDPVVKDNKINGITKYGVYVADRGSFTTIHGATIDGNNFELLKELKRAIVEQALNSEGKIIYQSKPINEIWAKMNNEILYNKKIDYYPTRNSNILESYQQRKD